MLPYQYSALPLPDTGKHTRLLRLRPGDFSNELHVELEQVLLDGTSNYEALSYVWGSTAHPVSILVGPSREHTISVTQNLATALQHLRNANESRVLWVDAVCIDQSNLAERSYQVTLMSDIFRAASRVIVWLGPEEDDSFYAINAMHAIGSSIDVDWINFTFKPRVSVNNSSSSTIEKLQDYRFRDKEASAVNRLLHRQWFERLWIRQEIGLATHAIIHCGRLTIPWHLFRSAVFFIHSKSHKLMSALGAHQYASFLSRLVLMWRICRDRVYRLQHLRIQLAQVVCTDPRDMIYGILSLLPTSQQAMGIVPDYTLDVALVYQDATLRFINYTKRLNILVQCELQDISSHVPTWVPDWSIDLKTTPIIGSVINASAGFEAIATIKEKGTLSVAGVSTATILDVLPMHFDESEDHFRTMLTTIWKVAISNSATSNETETSLLSAVCNALCCGMFRHTRIPIREDYPKFKSVMQTFKSKLATDPLLAGDVDTTDDWAKYLRRVGEMCRNRSFFVTTEGSVGIAPLFARTGDIVCVLLGCECTISLRQTGPNTYQVVGPSYMSGVNTGEALLGPLPEHFQPVSYYNDDAKAFRYAFWNKQTEDAQFEDPRLDTLLLNPGFQVHSQVENKFPRIKASVEALRNVGIAAQYFDLV